MNRNRSCAHGSDHAICEVPPDPVARALAHYPRPCLWAWTPSMATGRRAGLPAPHGRVPAAYPTLRAPFSPHVPWPPLNLRTQRRPVPGGRL